MAREWKEAELGQVADFLSGGTPPTGEPRYWGGSIPWVSAKDMKRFRLSDTEDHLTDAGVDNGTRQVPSGTVLLLTRGMTLLNDVPICIAGRAMTFNQDVKAVFPKAGVRAEFLPYLLLGNKTRLLNLVDLAGHGTGRLNTDELRALKIVLPPEPEQRAISRLFSTLDDKIELNRRMVETLELIARALFKSWFVDFDPVRAKADCRDSKLPQRLADLFPDSLETSDLGENPKGWSIAGLDQTANFLNGLALQKYPPKDGHSLPVVKIAQLRAGDTNDADKASAELDADYVVDDGDVLFSWSGSLECVIWAGGRGALNQHLFKVTSSAFPKWYYYLWIHHHLQDFRHIAAGKATTMGHIQRHHLSEAKVLVPDHQLLDAMSALLGPIIDQAWHRRAQSRTVAAVRDTLLPKVISSELRLVDAERAAQKLPPAPDG